MKKCKDLLEGAGVLVLAGFLVSTGMYLAVLLFDWIVSVM